MKEIDYYYDIYDGYIESVGEPDSVSISELMYEINDEKNNETYIFSDGILQEDYKLSSSFLDTEIDSIQFKKITNRRVTTKIGSGIDGVNKPPTIMKSFTRLKDYERSQFEKAFSNISAKTPIHKRVSGKDIEELISNELKARNLNSKFEYAVYSSRLATKVRSK